MTNKKRLPAVSFFVLFVLFVVTQALTVPAKDWGLGYPRPGQPPDGNETAEYLSRFGAFFMGSGNYNDVYLTFDAGYENGLTEAILDTLRKHDVPAAFFLVGTYIKSNPELIKKMVAEGHTVANHSMRHPDMTKLGAEAFAAELEKANGAYREIVGADIPRYYRPPQGTYSEDNLKAAQGLGYKTVFWSLSYRDFDVNAQPTREAAFSKLIPRMHPGAVILLHSTSRTSAGILEELIVRYRGMGYEFKSLDELR